MKIGFDGRWYDQCGVGNYVSGLLQAIRDVKNDIEIILYEDPRNPLEHIEGDRIRKVPFRARRYSLQEQLELAQRCRADGLDVFHAPFYVAPWLAPCPVVVTIHDLIPFLFDIYNLPKRQMIRLGYRLAAKKAARVIVVSKTTGQDLCRILRVPEEKTRVIHRSLASHCFHPHRENGEDQYLFARYGIRRPYVMALSAKNWRTKNLATVLKALSVCRRQSQSRFQTVIVGYPEGFHEASRQIAIEEGDVILPGFVPTCDLAKLYRCAEVFLMGSIYEGFGLPMLEAMSCGCAVVSSKAGSLSEVAGEGAVLVDPRDHVRMAETVSQLLNDAAELSRLKARALKRAADFSAEEEAKQTLSVYAEAAKQR